MSFTDLLSPLDDVETVTNRAIFIERLYAHLSECYLSGVRLTTIACGISSS